MDISIQDIDKSIREILNLRKNQYDFIYEKIDKGYRLVIDIRNLFYEKVNIIYTKFIFEVDNEKIYLLNDGSNGHIFKYLFDINCNYNQLYFDGIYDFEKLLKGILLKNKFGNNLKKLSEFIRNPGSLINDWFSKNNINNLSVYNVKMEENYNIMPCKSLFFEFTINLNNQIDIKLIIEKDNNEFIYRFKIYDKTTNVRKNNLNDLVETIGYTISKKYV